MGGPAAPVGRPVLRLDLQNVTLFAAALVAWIGVFAYVRRLGNGVGTMGMSLSGFVPMWSLMMTAMMLPTVAPVASLYVRTIAADRARRLLLFVGGYLLIWSATAVPAFLVLRFVDGRVARDPSQMRLVAVVVLAAAGLYQLTPLKALCLRHCRSPLGQLLRYGDARSPMRDLRMAAHHAGFCLGCCWALMALLIAFGIMNVWAMLGLVGLVISEKLWRHGERFGRVVGAAFIVIALTLAVSPRVAGAVMPSDPPSMSHM